MVPREDFLYSFKDLTQVTSNLILDPQAEPWDQIDGPSLACAAAALQLIPENISRLVRLHRLAAIGASLPRRPNAPALSASQLRKLLLRHEVTAAISEEDPYDDLYIGEIPFFNGPFRVIQGLTSRSAHTLRLMLDTIFRSTSRMPVEFQRKARPVASLILALSERICHIAGLERGLLPQTQPKTTILVPSRSRLDVLIRALKIDNPALAAAKVAGASEWVIGAGGHYLDLRGTTDEALILTPILEVEGTAYVVNPGELAARLRHHLIELAIEMNCVTDLVIEFRRTVFDRTSDLLRLIDATPVGEEEQLLESRIIRQRFKWVSGIELDVAVCTDDLAGFDSRDPYGQWNVNIGALIQEALDPESAPSLARKTLRLGVTDGFARAAFVGLEQKRDPNPLLVLPLDEFEVMAELDGTDPLFLWYFAIANEKIHEAARVLSFAILDTYAIYRANEYSFYLGDGPRPTFVNISAGEGLVLRHKVYTKHDKHYVPEPAGRGYCELVSLYGVDVGPIYLVHPRHDLLAYAVEVYGIRIWVQPANSDSRELRQLLMNLVEAVSFWVWQVTDPQNGAARLRLQSDATISLALDDEPRWIASLTDVDPADSNRDSALFSLLPSSDNGWTLKVHHQGIGILFRDSNEADRQLAESLGTVLLEKPFEAHDLDRIAPLGPKKMAHISWTTEVGRMQTARDSRTIRDAVTSQLLDELGDWIGSRDGATQGEIDRNERTAVLNRAVEFYFHQLQEEFAELAFDGLLQYLVGQDEALLAQSAIQTWRLPYYLACFGAQSVRGGKLLEREQAQVQASVASRFLIEYAATVQPSGDKFIDLLEYDRLLAISAELISKARLSDAIRYGFSDVKISVLPSGRLGISRGDSYTAGARAVLAADAETRLTTASAGVPREDRQSSPRHPPRDPLKLLSEVDTAMTDEFGLSFSELHGGLQSLVRLGTQIGGEFKAAREEEVVAYLKADLEWTDATVEAFRQTLTLRPRADFLSIGPDAYPWRYNRDASYIRRPVLCSTGNSNQTLGWGQRRLLECARYWHGMLLAGKVRATERKLKTLMSTIRQAENKHFEQETADSIREAGFCHSMAGVAKIAGERLKDMHGRDLGDIDVLAFDPVRNIILIAECKDLEIALTPFELANEVEALISGDRSAIVRVQGRANWIRGNPAAAMSHLGAEPSKTTPHVEAVVVTSRMLITAKSVPSSVPILSLAELPIWIGRLISSSGGRGARRRGRAKSKIK